MKKSKNREILKEMKEIYYPNLDIGDNKYLDWMGFEINSENKPSYHHITKYAKQKSDREAEQTTIENGAYLGEYSHIALHQIEKINIELYSRWNSLFKEIVKQRSFPSEDIWERVFELQIESITLFDNVETPKKKKR